MDAGRTTPLHRARTLWHTGQDPAPVGTTLGELGSNHWSIRTPNGWAQHQGGVTVNSIEEHAATHRQIRAWQPHAHRGTIIVVTDDEGRGDTLSVWQHLPTLDHVTLHQECWGTDQVSQQVLPPGQGEDLSYWLGGVSLPFARLTCAWAVFRSQSATHVGSLLGDAGAASLDEDVLEACTAVARNWQGDAKGLIEAGVLLTRS